MRKLLLTVALLFAAAASQAAPMTLTDLIGGQSMIAGDKLFDQWVVNYQGTSDGHLVNTNNILVTSLSDGGLDPGPGLHFSIQNNEFDVTGDDLFAFIDFQFSFRVSVLDPSLRIKDASMFNLLAFLSSTTDLNDGDNNEGSYIRESLGTAKGLDDLGINSVEFSILDSVVTTSLGYSSNFSPQSQIFVTKNILVWAEESTDSAGLTGFDQRFSQIPEPATLALAGLALAGLAAVRRRKSL